MEMSTIEIKRFIINYFNGISGIKKTPELCDQFMTDIVLKEHILFFDTIFPGYELFAEEILVEGNQAIVKARMTGVNKGEFNGIPPTYRNVDFAFAIGYTIEEGMISKHWMIADQVSMMQQLGIEVGAEH